MSWIFEELVAKGKEKGEIDVVMIDELIKKGVFEVAEVEPMSWLRDAKELHRS